MAELELEHHDRESELLWVIFIFLFLLVPREG
jgi:hypothetical protein